MMYDSWVHVALQSFGDFATSDLDFKLGFAIVYIIYLCCLEFKCKLSEAEVIWF